jgi:hypothetical protein
MAGTMIASQIVPAFRERVAPESYGVSEAKPLLLQDADRLN